MHDTLAIEGGFADPVIAGQRGFKAIMDALARPGTVQQLPAEAQPPAPLPRGLAEIALTLCDHDSPVWLDPTLAAAGIVAEWLRFHTGAPLVTAVRDADFAFVTAEGQLPNLAAFAIGTDEYPDRSATISLSVPSLTGGPALRLRGPGIKDEASIDPQGLPADFIAQWAENRALFPRGVDLLLVAPEGLIGLPRSTRISAGGQ
ncbi:phosphonate C-P lyase system protein PhnH [Devosia sp.]|jgi:alpha-D-ribose 1-methylphosphonate 5-triphosphate synthase subunit PhnH|uniref:phosphonate C-P lyase system protein PhnH n=1 Tax=Devosia sp. TaxID=1871048 RepID=UPI0037BF0472